MRRLQMLSVAALLLVAVGQGAATADVTAVEGSAYGYFSNVSLFGGPFSTRGPSPTVTLPPGGSASPLTSTQTTASAQYGPATIFSSGPLTVTTQGTTGPNGSVTTTTDVDTVNTSGTEVFTAANVASTCTADENGISASTTITSGTLQTSEGNPDVDGDETVVNIPTNPAANTEYSGTIESVGDSFRYVFNERTVNPDGSITVTAAHQYLQGPNAVGDLYIGHAECGVTGGPDSIAPRVRSTFPTPDAVGVGRSKNVKAVFSEAMRVGSINGTTFRLFRVGSNTAVAATVTYDAYLRRAILDPTNPLRLGTTYKAVVSTYAKDLAGNRLDQNASVDGRQRKVWYFEVRN